MCHKSYTVGFIFKRNFQGYDFCCIYFIFFTKLMVKVFLKIRRGLITVMEVLDALIRCFPGEREVFLATPSVHKRMYV
jgi:hypothetical protein